MAADNGALRFSKGLNKLYLFDTADQRCWVNKTANVLNSLSMSVQPTVKAWMHEIWMADPLRQCK
jgi:hypothetical protein